MNRYLAAALLPLLWAGPALAQHEGHAGHTAPAAAPPPAAAPADPHAGHDMSAMPGMTPAPSPEAEAEPEIPDVPPPPPPGDHLADRFFDPASMAAARRQLRLEHGGAATSQVMANLLEYRSGSGEEGYHWEGEAWFGGDLHRLVLKTEGEGARGEGVTDAEVQALYSRPIGPYFDLQAGVRRDIEPRARTYGALGVEGLAPYWFEVEAAVFLSTEGDILGRVGSSYDLRLTQKLTLQPRVELNWAAQDIAETHTGSGISDAEFGLRLRYEIRREFAPYIGVSHERKFGRSADFARAAGEDVKATSFVVGLRAWF